jgi:hypothetical protein
VPYSQNDLKRIFEARGYETLTYREPVVCPVYGGDPGRTHSLPYACCDVVVAVHELPRMNAVALLHDQARHGCALPRQNRAIIVHTPLTAAQQNAVREAAIACFPAAFDQGLLETWLAECEARLSLEMPIAHRRRVARRACNIEVLFRLTAEGRDMPATALNISDCGVCIRLARQLRPQQQLILTELGREVSEDALVRWVRQENDGSYVAGLDFCL